MLKAKLAGLHGHLIQLNNNYIHLEINHYKKEETLMAQTFVNQNNKVVARGTISLAFVDLILNDGSRFYSTQSDDYSTLNFIRSLDIAKANND